MRRKTKNVYLVCRQPRKKNRQKHRHCLAEAHYLLFSSSSHLALALEADVPRPLDEPRQVNLRLWAVEQQETDVRARERQSFRVRDRHEKHSVLEKQSNEQKIAETSRIGTGNETTTPPRCGRMDRTTLSNVNLTLLKIQGAVKVSTNQANMRANSVVHFDGGAKTKEDSRKQTYSTVFVLGRRTPKNQRYTCRKPTSEACTVSTSLAHTPLQTTGRSRQSADRFFTSTGHPGNFNEQPSENDRCLVETLHTCQGPTLP